MSKKKSPLSKMTIRDARDRLIAAGANPSTASPYKMAVEVLSLRGLSIRGGRFDRLRRALSLTGGVVPAAPKKAKPRPTPVDAKKAFYASWEWRTLRMEVLKEHGPVCQCCGAKRGDTTVGGQLVKIVVDHIKPISKYWNLRLVRSNLQVLCDECNMGKGAWDETDYRPVDDPLPEGHVLWGDSWDDFENGKVN